MAAGNLWDGWTCALDFEELMLKEEVQGARHCEGKGSCVIVTAMGLNLSEVNENVLLALLEFMN